MKHAVQFGAGNIGRGFIGAVLAQAGYTVTFADVVEDLLTQINARGGYTVHVTDHKKYDIEVKGVSAVHSGSDAAVQAIVGADIVTTAVGLRILKFVAPTVAAGITARKAAGIEQPLNVMACENGLKATSQLKELVFASLDDQTKAWAETHVGFPDAAVDRIVPPVHCEIPLDVAVEEFFEWDAERSGFVGEVPVIPGMTPVDNLLAYIERKLFTVNTGHASIAYLAYRKGIKDIYSAMQDKNIVDMARKVWQETGDLLVRKFGFDPKKHEEYVKTTENRFRNPHLSDEVTRVARGPKRKLGAKDRLVSPATQLLAQGQKPSALATVIGAAFHFDYDGDKEAQEVQGAIQEKGLHKAILNYTQIPEESELFRMVENKTAGF
jgi:mannitol-1-phosphate 5-dehydrogenase